MKAIFCAIAVLFLMSSNAVAFEKPMKSVSAEKGTKSKCMSHIKSEARSYKSRGYQCRTVMGIVYVCDNNSYHIELSCDGSKVWIETLPQDGSDWKRFYVD